MVSNPGGDVISGDHGEAAVTRAAMAWPMLPVPMMLMCAMEILP